MKKILFSCAGTTDPVRGEHDGPMLHILRKYRPEEVWLFLTPEIDALAWKDGRFEKTKEWILRHWDGYQPEFRYIRSDIENVHDIDTLALPLRKAMTELACEFPDAEILINVTSGTPQMQMILSQLAMDIRYRAKGVQVSTFEKGSGQAQRTNHGDYDVDLELECNEDELPDSEDRCSEPQMYALHREYLRRQILSLLDTRDFEAVEQLADSLPENIRALALHLAARSRLQADKAVPLAGKVKGLPFPLYAYKTGSRGKYAVVSEYYLRMKNLAKAGNLTGFLLHLEPLTLTLQTATLDRQLRETGHGIRDFQETWDRRTVFDPSRLKNALPALYRHYTQTLDPRKTDMNTRLCQVLLDFYPDVPETAKRLFAHYDQLKDLRNRLAHELCAITEADIKAACGAAIQTLLAEIEGTIIACYPACDPAIFSVYDKCIEYIRQEL